MARLEVLISGAGIAGNALAFWLSKLGHKVSVIERFPNLRTSGLQVDLRGHGIEVLKRMGLESDFRANAVPELGMQIVDSSGGRRAYFPAKQSGKIGPQSFTSEFEIMRGDLCRILYDATKKRAKYMFGTSIESFEEKGNAVEVQFTNGETGRFDILVGADGLHSRTRNIMLGSDIVDAFHPLDEYTAYFTIPQPPGAGGEYVATSYIAPGGRFIMTRRHGPNRIQVYLTGKSVTGRLKAVRRGDVGEEKKAFAEAFRGAGWQADAISESLIGADDFYCESQGLVKLNPWYQGRVVLLGDAAYCPSASTGMGTSSAIVGAYILAGEIERHFGAPGCEEEMEVSKRGLHGAAFQAFDDKFRPFINHVQKGVGDRSVFDRIPWSPLTITVLHWVMWLVSILRLDMLEGLLGDQPVKGWELPEYETLRGFAKPDGSCRTGSGER
ncbi:FAD/NAD(P)-binding domain-containing protein [Aspergillus granulosus]|uniref:FAD/NAD(P)-binding domain-containing protein n=1 Tax=Aspergillus granulosus TaxID=176169 RepID=A0ABR4H1I4_9EURO